LYKIDIHCEFSPGKAYTTGTTVQISRLID